MIALAIAAAAPWATAQEFERRIAVTLDATNPARTWEDAISDFEAVAYVVPLRQGQKLHLLLASNNASNCFDVYAPGASKPVYVGGESGNAHAVQAQVAGDYVIRVYLLRLAARDGQSAQYALEMKLAQ